MENNTFTHENSFLVGSARATVWAERSVANALPAYRITVERRCDAGEEGSWTPILRMKDITPAILALKKAYDFLKHNAGRKPGETQSIAPSVPYLPPRP